MLSRINIILKNKIWQQAQSIGLRKLLKVYEALRSPACLFPTHI